MFKKLVQWLRRAVAKILPTNSLEKATDYKIDISDVMVDAIELWGDMYVNKPYWVDGHRVKSLNIASAITSEIARLTTIEMESVITGGKSSNARAEYLDEQYQKIVDKLRIETEYACAKGGMVFKPYIDKNDNIAVEFVQADEFYPVEFNSSGDLVGAIFTEVIQKKKQTFTRLEFHQMQKDNKCLVTNKAFVKQTEADGLGYDVALASVEEWANLEEEIILHNIEKPLFSYFKIPLANNLDTKSKIGVSVYSKATELIKDVDRHYSSILWEYESKETAIDVPMDMFMSARLPKGKERLFRQLDVETQNKTFYEVFSPEIRDVSLFNGLNKLLEKVEFNCGLAYGTLSDIQDTVKTATEIKMSKQRSYATIKDIQKALQIALEHLVSSMDYMADLYNITPSGEYEISFDFDDSIVVDAKEEQMIMLNEVASELIKPEFYLMKRYGVTEKQALEMLPNLDSRLDPKDFDDLEQ